MAKARKEKKAVHNIYYCGSLIAACAAVYFGFRLIR